MLTACGWACVLYAVCVAQEQMVVLIDPSVARLRELLATLEPDVLRRVVACHRQLETADFEAAAADAVFADGQHVPELFQLARLPSQQESVRTQGQDARGERMSMLLRRIGRLLSLAAVTVVEVQRPVPPSDCHASEAVRRRLSRYSEGGGGAMIARSLARKLECCQISQPPCRSVEP